MRLIFQSNGGLWIGFCSYQLIKQELVVGSVPSNWQHHQPSDDADNLHAETWASLKSWRRFLVEDLIISQPVVSPTFYGTPMFIPVHTTSPLCLIVCQFQLLYGLPSYFCSSRWLSSHLPLGFQSLSFIPSAACTTEQYQFISPIYAMCSTHRCLLWSPT